MRERALRGGRQEGVPGRSGPRTPRGVGIALGQERRPALAVADGRPYRAYGGTAGAQRAAMTAQAASADPAAAVAANATAAERLPAVEQQGDLGAAGGARRGGSRGARGRPRVGRVPHADPVIGRVPLSRPVLRCSRAPHCARSLCQRGVS